MSRITVASAVSGATLLIGAPVAWQWSQPPDTVGDVPASTAAETQTAEPDLAPAAVGRDAIGSDADLARDAVGADAEAPETDPSEASDADRDPVAPPSGLSIPAIGVEAPVVPVGLEEDRTMEIPHDVATIGWYDPGVMPGEQGTAVLSGHVDSRSQGRGAFWDLRRLDVDDIVSIDHDDGTTSEWRVTARTVYAKDELPIADIFTRFGDTRLVLITCGGAFDNTARSYDDNVVVYTEPVDA